MKIRIKIIRDGDNKVTRNEVVENRTPADAMLLAMIENHDHARLQDRKAKRLKITTPRNYTYFAEEIE